MTIRFLENEKERGGRGVGEEREEEEKKRRERGWGGNQGLIQLSAPKENRKMLKEM